MPKCLYQDVPALKAFVRKHLSLEVLALSHIEILKLPFASGCACMKTVVPKNLWLDVHALRHIKTAVLPNSPLCPNRAAGFRFSLLRLFWVWQVAPIFYAYSDAGLGVLTSKEFQSLSLLSPFNAIVR